MIAIRKPAVAGSFYPRDPAALDGLVGRLLSGRPDEGPRPKALVVPHAGYDYSGPVAAVAYRRLRRFAGSFARVVLVGPSHWLSFEGMAVPTVDIFRTPLGDVLIDRGARQLALACPGVVERDDAHRSEHSLEVQLPFLQAALGIFRLLPVAVSAAPAADVAALLEKVWGGRDTLVVVSTDLSHGLAYPGARRLDAATAEAILELEPDRIADDAACGLEGLQGLLLAARARGLGVELLDLRNSGDTSRSRGGVVGYGAFAFCEPDAHPAAPLTP